MHRIESIIIKNLLYNDEYTRKVLPFIKEEYFLDGIERLLFSEIHEFVNQYKNLPTYEALVINFTEKDKLTEEQVSSVVELLNDIRKNKNESSDEQWLLNQTENFCQSKALYNAIRESVLILDDKIPKKSKGEIPSLLSDALAVSFDNNIGHDYTNDFDGRYDSYHKVESRVKTDLEMFNKITNGGFPVKTLNIFMSPPGGGKTLTMCHLAAACVAQGYNVLYLSMEMSEERIAERIDANLLNTTIPELHSMSKPDYSRKFGRLLQKAQGKLIIKEYPTASASVLHFRALLNDLKLKKSFTPDIIFIDYLNICCSSRVKQGGSVNSYMYVKSIAEEVRGLAVENNVPIITSVQANRAGYNNSDVDMSNTSDSAGINATADLMLAVISNEELDALNQFLFKQLKNRYGDPNKYKRFVVGVDKSKMRLYDVEDAAQKGISDSGQDDDPPPINTFGNRERKFKGLKV